MWFPCKYVVSCVHTLDTSNAALTKLWLKKHIPWTRKRQFQNVSWEFPAKSWIKSPDKVRYSLKLIYVFSKKLIFQSFSLTSKNQIWQRSRKFLYHSPKFFFKRRKSCTCGKQVSLCGRFFCRNTSTNFMLQVHELHRTTTFSKKKTFPQNAPRST